MAVDGFRFRELAVASGLLTNRDRDVDRRWHFRRQCLNDAVDPIGLSREHRKGGSFQNHVENHPRLARLVRLIVWRP